MSAGEIKSTLTLDASNFSAAIEKAQTGISGLEKGLVSATKITADFEKSVAKMGEDVGGVGKQFSTLASTLGSLIDRLDAGVGSGLERVSKKARAAKEDIAGLAATTEKTGTAFVSMADWTQRYGAVMESIHPKIALLTKSQQELQSATTALGASSTASAEVQIRAKIKTLEAEKTVNAESIQAKRKLIGELALLDGQASRESEAARLKAADAARRLGTYGGKNIIANSSGDAATLEAYSTGMRRQAVALTELIDKEQLRNLEIGNSITWLGRRADFAETSAAREKEATKAALQANFNATVAKKAADALAAKETKDIKIQEEAMWRKVENDQAALASVQARFRRQQAVEEHRAARKAMRDADGLGSDIERDQIRATLEAKRAAAAAAKIIAKDASDYAKQQDLQAKDAQKDWNAQQLAEKKAGIREVADAERAARNASMEANRAQQAAVRTADRERLQAIREQGALERQQAQQTIDMWKGMGAMWAGAKIEKGLLGAVGSADQAERTQVSVQSLNYTPEHNKMINDSAAAMSKDLKFISTLDAVKSRMSAIASIGYDNAKIIDSTLTTAVKAANNLNYLNFSHGDMQSTIRNLYGVVEMRQQTGSAEKTNSTMEVMQKIITGTQGKVQTQDMENVLRRIGQGAGQLSDHGMYNLAGVVDQFKVAGGEGGGSSGGVSTVGTSFKMMQAYAIGKGKTAEAIKEFAGAGILDTGSLDLSKDKAGVLSDAKHAGFKNAKLWMDDPVAAVQEIMPKIIAYTQKKENVGKFYQGADPKDEMAQMAAVSQYLARLGITTSAAQAMMVAGDPRSKERLDHQVKTMSGSKDINQVDADQKNTYGRLVQETTASLSNLGVIVGNALLPALKSVLKVVGDIVTAIAEFASTHSATTKVVALSAAFAGIVLTLKGFMSVFGMVTGGMDSVFGKIASSFGIMSKSAKASEIANIAHLQSQVNMTAASRDFTAMKLKEAQGNVTGLVGMKDVVTAHQTAAKATAEHTAASRLLNQAHADTGFSMKKLGGGLMTLAGGPIGILIAAITLAGLAWDYFGNSAENAAKKAENAARRAKAALDGVSSTEAVASNRAEIKDKKKQIAGMEYDANAAYQSGDVGNTARDAAARSAIAVAQQELNVLLAEEARHKVNIAKADADAVQVAKDLVRMQQLTAAAAAGHARAAGELRPAAGRPHMSTGLKFESNVSTAGTAKADAAVVAAASGGSKPEKVLESFFLKQFETIEARAKELHLKLNTILTGKTSYQEQAKAFVTGELLAGNLDKGHDASKREFTKNGFGFNAKTGQYSESDGRGGRMPVSGEKAIDFDKKGVNGLTLNDMVSAKTDELKAADELKAVTFAKERLTATEATLQAAQDRTTEGTGKQTSALSALQREYARLDKGRIPGATDNKEYETDKAASLLNQAKSDMLNYMADMEQKTETMAANLTIGENLQQINSRDRLVAMEDNKIEIIRDAYRTKLADLREYGGDEKAFQAQHEKQMAIIMRQRAEALMTPLQKLVSGWSDTRAAIENSQVQWANGFVSVIQNALNGADTGFKQLMVSILKDIQSTMIKNALGGVVQGAVGGIGNAANKLIGAGGTGAIGGAAGAAGGAAGKDNAIWSMFSRGLTDGAKGLDGMINSVTGLNDHMVENIANWIIQLFTGEAKVAGDATQIEASLALSATMTFAATSVATLGAAAAASAAAMSGGSIISAVASANGNIMTDMGPLTLNKYANGGIATSPQLSLFGEGKMNEAYVPLPDGRSIPVTVKGGGDGGGTSVVIQINVQSDGTSSTSASASNDWSKMADRVRGIVVDEMATQKRPGGILYK